MKNLSMLRKGVLVKVIFVKNTHNAKSENDRSMALEKKKGSL